MTAALLAIATRDARPDQPNAHYIAKMQADLNKAEQQAKQHPTNRDICPKCSRLTRFCEGC